MRAASGASHRPGTNPRGAAAVVGVRPTRAAGPASLMSRLGRMRPVDWGLACEAGRAG